MEKHPSMAGILGRTVQSALFQAFVSIEQVIAPINNRLVAMEFSWVKNGSFSPTLHLFSVT
jgi:hypothetical protein